MTKITERSTKATILKALREAEKKITDLEKGKLDAKVETEAKKKTETIEKSNHLMEINIEDQITDLSKSISHQLNKINEEVIEQTKNLQTVKEAIALKEAELKELFDIEKQAYTLAGLVDAHQELKLAQEKEFISDQETAAAKLEEIEQKIQAAQKEHDTLIKEQKEQLKQTKQREEDDFQYNFERHQKKAYDTLEDELTEKRKTFDTETEKTNKELDEYKKTLTDREQSITERETKMDQLEAEVEAIPTKIEEVKKEANEKAEAKIKKTVAIRENSIKREIEADKRILEKERDNLKAQLEAAHESINTLQAKLDGAYERIQQMGIQMVSRTNENKAYDKIASLVSDKNSKS